MTKKKRSELEEYGSKILGYASKLTLSEVIVLASTGLFLSIKAVAAAFDRSKQKYTHVHYVGSTDGELIWSDEMWLNGQHACDGKYLNIAVKVPTALEISEHINSTRSLDDARHAEEEISE